MNDAIAKAAIAATHQEVTVQPTVTVRILKGLPTGDGGPAAAGAGGVCDASNRDDFDAVGTPPL